MKGVRGPCPHGHSAALEDRLFLRSRSAPEPITDFQRRNPCLLGRWPFRSYRRTGKPRPDLYLVRDREPSSPDSQERSCRQHQQSAVPIFYLHPSNIVVSYNADHPTTTLRSFLTH